MPETMRIGCDGIEKWHWWQVQADLVEQGELNREDIFIDPLSCLNPASSGTYKDSDFMFSWAKDEFCMVSMVEYSQELIDAFSNVVGYKPFGKYIRYGFWTVEWNKENAAQMIKEISEIEDITNFSLL